jgi:ricin-type beta-trefoil lectin protein
MSLKASLRLAIPATIVASLIAQSPAAHATIYSDISNAFGSGGVLCLDAENDAVHHPWQNGDKVQVWSCNGQSNQQWSINDTGGTATGDPIFTITNEAAPGMCLDAQSDATHFARDNGDPVQMWACNGQSNQQWVALLGSNNADYIESAGWATVLDAQWDGTHNPGVNGDPVQMWDYHNGAYNQQWYI